MNYRTSTDTARINAASAANVAQIHANSAYAVAKYTSDTNRLNTMVTNQSNIAIANSRNQTALNTARINSSTSMYNTVFSSGAEDTRTDKRLENDRNYPKYAYGSRCQQDSVYIRSQHS